MPRTFFGLSARWLSYIPTVAVLLALGVIGWVGHERGWHWEAKPPEKSEAKKPAEEETTPESADEDGQYGFSPFDSTLPITHDPQRCGNENRLVKTFPNLEAVRKAGIYLGTVQQREMEDVLTVTAAPEFDPNYVARVAPRVGGTVYWIRRQVGEKVDPNEIVAIIDSPEVGKAKAAFRMARLQVEVKQQYRETLQTGVNPPRTIAEADAAVREARLNVLAAYQSLLALGLKLDLAKAERMGDIDLQRYLHGLGLEDVSDLLAQETSENLVAVRNPLNRKLEVLKREIVTGEPVAAQQTIFVLADPSQMVLMIDIPQEKRQRVHIGQEVTYSDERTGGKNMTGSLTEHIDWISPEIDPKVRTVKARAFIKNANGQLKANAFGTARITLGEGKLATVIPEEAIQWEGCSHIVFAFNDEELDTWIGRIVQKTGLGGLPAIGFRVRKVTLGIRGNGFVEVIGYSTEFALDFFELFTDDGWVRCESGLKPGERIAVRGSHVLKSELFRDRLGSPEE